MNQDDRIKYNKEYYTKNKAKIQAKYKEKVTCPICKAEVCNAHYYTQHKRSKKCLKHKKEQEEEKKERLKQITTEEINTLKELLKKFDLNDFEKLL